LFIEGCDLFSTRNPETPDIGNSGIIPPTEPSTLILNLENSLKSKNLDNYMNCFYTFKDNANLEFIFFPATDGLTQFPSSFAEWGANEERRSITSIFNSISADQGLTINWINRKPVQETADSAVFTSDYIIHSPNNDNTIPDFFAGRLQFTMNTRENGLWYISKWIDINIQVVDSVKNSWSMLKAYYYN
jgi:hypothetical protein